MILAAARRPPLAPPPRHPPRPPPPPPLRSIEAEYSREVKLNIMEEVLGTLVEAGWGGFRKGLGAGCWHWQYPAPESPCRARAAIYSQRRCAQGSCTRASCPFGSLRVKFGFIQKLTRVGFNVVLLPGLSSFFYAPPPCWGGVCF